METTLKKLFYCLRIQCFLFGGVGAVPPAQRPAFLKNH
jgi:hypothetical protein